MTNREEKIISLIKDYQNSARKVCELLKSKYNEPDLLSAWKSNRIEKEGFLDKENVIQYSLHGVGCSAESNDFFINFDFGPNGRCDGFDLWRLKIFYEENVENYSEINENDIEEAFKVLESEKIISCPKWEPSSHLFYFKDSI